VACVDPDEGALDRARQHAAQKHHGFFTTLGEAMATVSADAALIASPTVLHASHTIEALNGGLAVLVEKPLAIDLTEAVTVVESSRTRARPVMVAENYRFFPAERTLRHMLTNDVAGRLSSALCIDRRDQPSRTQGAWVKAAEYPFLTEIAIHHFDTFRYLFGHRPASMFATSYNPAGSTYDRHAAAEALIELEDGFPVQYAGTMISNRYEYALTIEGEKADIWTDRKRVWWRPRGKRFFSPFTLVPVPKGDDLPYPKAGTVSLLNQFRDLLVSQRTPETSAEDNLWTLAMVDASVLSDREERKVAIDEVFTPALKRRVGVPAS